MAWTEITRGKSRRDGLRHASDVTDAEWALIEPLFLEASGEPLEASGEPPCIPSRSAAMPTWSRRGC